MLKSMTLRPLLIYIYIYIYIFHDNVFVTVVTSIQYQALSDKSANAFYKLNNTRAQKSKLKINMVVMGV